MTERLNVSIIGGGLAGALTARVLRERYNVTILERTTDLIEVGAAINVGPNGVRILAKYGFDRQKAGSNPVRKIKNWDKDGKMLLENKINAKEEYGDDWLFQHRADLRAEFLRLATAPSQDLGLTGEPARIRYGAKIVNVDVDKGLFSSILEKRSSRILSLVGPPHPLSASRC
jgi:salicylate hydroxylase